MKFIFLTILFLTSCAPKMGYVGKNYEASMSPCLDGIAANIEYFGCKSLYFGLIPNTDIFKMRCSFTSEKNEWTYYNFYFVPSGSESLVKDSWEPMCKDVFVDSYFENPLSSYE